MSYAQVVSLDGGGIKERSALTGNLGQLYLQGGFCPRLPDGPSRVGGGLPEAGGGGLPAAGKGDEEDDANPTLQENPLLLPMNGSLKGTTPVIFNGNRKNMKKFTQEFALYCMINQDSVMMKNPYTYTALALSFLRGPTINNWVLQ
jgi:hypothetical protein